MFRKGTGSNSKTLAESLYTMLRNTQTPKVFSRLE